MVEMRHDDRSMSLYQNIQKTQAIRTSGYTHQDKIQVETFTFLLEKVIQFIQHALIKPHPPQNGGCALNHYKSLTKFSFLAIRTIPPTHPLSIQGG